VFGACGVFLLLSAGTALALAVVLGVDIRARLRAVTARRAMAEAGARRVWTEAELATLPACRKLGRQLRPALEQLVHAGSIRSVGERPDRLYQLVLGPPDLDGWPTAYDEAPAHEDGEG
jgi:hypothetical protein